MNQAILDEAILLQTLGYDIILVAADKNPGIVKDWPTHKWDDAELLAWLNKGQDLSLALRLGNGVIDCEIDADDDAKREALERRLQGLMPDGLLTPSWRSKRGRHWLFRVTPIFVEALSEKDCPSKIVVDEFEFRLGLKPAQSLIPTPGNDYRAWVTAPETDIAPLPNSLWNSLYNAALAKWKGSKATKTEYTPPENRRPGDVFNESVSWEDVLVPHDWSHVGGDKWCRPGKHGEISATTGYCSSEVRGELFYCFSTSDEVFPVEPEKAYSKFELWACLNHGGDFRVAAAAAARSGYSPEIDNSCSEFMDDPIIPDVENVPKHENAPDRVHFSQKQVKTGQSDNENDRIAPDRVQKPVTAGHPRLDLTQFNDPLTNYCLALKDISAADTGAIWFQCNELFANFLGHNPRINWSGKEYYLNGSMFLVGPTATGKKGLSLSAAKAPFNQSVHSEFSDDIEFSIYSKCIAGGFQSGQAIVSHFRKDKNAESEVDKRLIIVEEETATILKMAKLENSILSQVMRTAFDGGTLEYRVSKIKGEGSTIHVEDAHVSVIGHITGDELVKVLTTGADRTGELNRIQFVLCLDSKFVKYKLSNFLFSDLKQLGPLRSHFLECGAWARNRRIEIAEETYELLDEYTEKHDLDLRAGKERAINARLPQYLIKWMGRFAVLDKSPVADMRHYRLARSVVDYLKNSNEFVLGEWLDGVDKDLIDKAVCLIEEAPAGVRRAEIGKELFGHHWTLDKVDGVLAHARKRLALIGKTVKERRDRNKVLYHL